MMIRTRTSGDLFGGTQLDPQHQEILILLKILEVLIQIKDHQTISYRQFTANF